MPFWMKKNSAKVQKLAQQNSHLRFIAIRFQFFHSLSFISVKKQEKYGIGFGESE